MPLNHIFYTYHMKEKLEQLMNAIDFNSEFSVLVSAMCYLTAILILLFVLR
jgi:hypothetical protein